MIRLAGKVPDEDIEVAYTGLRPAEKLVEELFHEKETLAPTGPRQILLARHQAPRGRISRYLKGIGNF